MLAVLPRHLAQATHRAVLQEAHALRREIVQGLTAQAPGGQSLEPPAELTLAARRLTGFGGTKALIVRGDLRGAIAVVVQDGEVFVGVPRAARGQDGQSLVDVAWVQEHGSDPIVIPITPAMRRFLAVLYREAGRPREPGSGAGVVVVQIPARPFLRPAFDRFKVGLSRRLLGRIERLLRQRGR
jgi:hypothetical protein